MAFVSFGAASEIANHPGHLLGVVSFHTAFKLGICLFKLSKLKTKTAFVSHHVRFAPPQKTFSLA